MSKQVTGKIQIWGKNPPEHTVMGLPRGKNLTSFLSFVSLCFVVTVKQSSVCFIHYNVSEK